MSDEIIRVSGLVKRFGGVKALDHVDLSVCRGDVVVIVGPSGSGKSTLLRSLNLLEKPTEGSIFVDGVDITAKGVNIDLHRREMGMVFQHFNLFPHLTILENHDDRTRSRCLSRNRRSVSRMRASYSPASVWPIARTPIRRSFPAARSSASPSCARCAWSRRSCCLMSRPRALDPEMVGEVLDVMRDLAKERHDDGRRHARDGLCPRGRQPRFVRRSRPDHRGKAAAGVSSHTRNRRAYRISCPRYCNPILP